MKSWYRLLAALVMAAIPALGSAVEGSFDRTLKVTGAVQLDVKSGAGSITVRNGDAATVRVHGVIRASSGREAPEKVRQLESIPPIEQNGNTIRVGHIEDRDLGRNVSISYELLVPVETRLNSHTGSGNQSIEGICGPVSAGTGSGSVIITKIGDEVTARTGSGDIKLDSVNGKIQAATGSGDIRGAGIGGAILATTGSGSVKLEQSAPGSVEVRTGSGEVEVGGVKGPLRVQTGSGNVIAQGEPSEEWNLGAASGDVTVRLPSQAAFDLHARTGSGRISTDHPLTLQGAVNPKQMQGKVRGGGFRLNVSTASGDIRIQ